MESKKQPINSAPPRLIASFLTGFNAVASHIWLIILPVILDLFLWFGPRINVKSLFSPILNKSLELFSESGTPEIQAVVNSSQVLWEETLVRFNFLSFLRTLPIGVPSLLSGRGVVLNPLGSPQVLDLPSLGIMLLLWVGLVLVGIAVGSVFFGEVARISLTIKESFSVQRFFKLFKHTFLLTLSAYGLLVLLSIPVFLLVLIVSLISPALTQVSIIFLSLVLIWLLLPLIFAPHGIYTLGQNVFTSAIHSIRLVRYFLPGTGVFLMMSVLISQGLDLLWSFPPENSWMVMIGIFGHAFIATSLLASSFVYYQGGVQWMNDRLRLMRESAGKQNVTLGQH